MYNPDVLEKIFDKDFVSPFLSLGFEVRAALITVFEGDFEGFVNILELFLQVYGTAVEGASAKEIMDVLHEVQRRVKEKYQVHLPLDVRMLGEDFPQE